MARTTVEVEIEGRRLTLSNLEKVLYPAAGFTKAEVISYYTAIAPALLLHLAGRHLTMKRYPEGVDGMFFFEKKCPAHRPDWVRTAPVWSPQNDADIEYCMVDDLPTLVWAANLADLELHTPMARAGTPDSPTMVVFDLDPGPPADIVDCCQVALWLRDLFAGLGLDAYIKTSGSKGMQLYVPLNTPATYELTTPFAHSVARALEQEHPDRVVSDMKKSLREGKVLIDWSQNSRHKTTICVYSLRARQRPTVSTPVMWDEVEEALAAGDASRLSFETADVLDRVERHGDLFAPVLRQEQKLTAVAASASDQEAPVRKRRR